MAINKKLIHFSKQENFDNEVANNNILDTSICFIKDSKSISTHGTIYPTVNWSMLIPTTGVVNGYDWVDLGLPSGLKWAAYNIGATTATEYGDYYAWGEVLTKETYTPDNCETYGIEMDDISGNPYYDVANKKWGGTWRIPTKYELEELVEECDWIKAEVNGVKGYKVTGPNGNSIFLPFAGYYSRSSFLLGGYLVYYQSSTPDGTDKAYYLLLESTCGVYDISRSYGCTIRPVINI